MVDSGNRLESDVTLYSQRKVRRQDNDTMVDKYCEACLCTEDAETFGRLSCTDPATLAVTLLIIIVIILAVAPIISC